MLKKLSIALACVASAAVQAASLVVLPTAPFDGLGPQTFDEGTVYSAKMLDQMRSAGRIPATTGPFDSAQGSGTLGIIVYSSNGVSNPAGWENQMDAQNSGDFDGTWGSTKTGTIGLLRTFLEGYQPLFVFDHNENRGGDLLITGEVRVRRGSTVLAAFSLDGTANGSYDQSNYITSCGNPDVGPGAPAPYGDCSIPAPTDSGTTYTWTTNGSGKPDYFALFAGWDLYSASFLDSDTLEIQMSLRGNDSGFEELSIIGYRMAAPGEVSEPGSIALMGLGLAAMGWRGRRRR